MKADEGCIKIKLRQCIGLIIIVFAFCILISTAIYTNNINIGSINFIQLRNTSFTPITSKDMNDNMLRVAFVTRTSDWRLGGGEHKECVLKHFKVIPIYQNLKNDSYILPFSEIISHGSNLINITWCHCFYDLGWIIQWNADIIYIGNFPYDKLTISNIFKYTLSQYDVLIFRGENVYGVLNWNKNEWSKINQIYRNGTIQYRYYIHTEVQYFLRNQKLYELNQTPFYEHFKSHNLFPILIDNWGTMQWTLNATKLGVWKFWEGVWSVPAITFPYNYPWDLFTQFKKNNLNYCKNVPLFNQLIKENKLIIYITHRCHMKHEIYNYLLQNNINATYYIWYEDKHTNLNTHQYYCLLTITKYAFHFENTWATGQVIGESSIYGILVFTYSQKYFGSLLMNRFLFIDKQRDWMNLIDKFNFLESHPWVYNKIKIEIIQRSKQIFLYSKYSAQQFVNDSVWILQQQNMSRKYLNYYLNN